MKPNSHKPVSVRLRQLLWLLLACLLSPTFSQAAEISGRVSDVPDAYRILLVTDDNRRLNITLSGLTLPDPNNRNWQRIARRHLHMLLAGRVVSVEHTMKRSRGVIIGLVRHGGADIGLRMIGDGLAVIDRRSLLTPAVRARYLEAQNEAQRRRVGFWQPAR